MALKRSLPPFAPTSRNLLEWATRMHEFITDVGVEASVPPQSVLLRHQIPSQLSRATEDGIMEFDPSIEAPVISHGGLWNPMGFSVGPTKPNFMNWSGDWLPDTEYHLDDVVLDNGWLAIANKNTFDRPSPQTIIEPVFLYTGAAPTTTNVFNQIISGMRYVGLVGRILNITGYRVYTNVGDRFTITVVEDPLGTPRATVILAFIATTNGWLELPISDHFVLAGETLDIFATITEPNPIPVTFTGEWDYVTPQNDDVPATGEILHSTRQADTIRVHKTDFNGGDRSVELLNLVGGDRIEGPSAFVWTVITTTDDGTHVSYTVTPIVQTAPIGVYDFVFETVPPTAIRNVLDTDFWALTPNISSIRGLGVPYPSATIENHQTSIDIRAGEVTLSPDWDILAVSDIGSSSGSLIIPNTIFLEELAAPLVITEAAGLVDILTLTEPDIPAGTYVFTVSFVTEFALINDQIHWNVTGDVTSPLFLKEAKDANENIPFSFSFPVTLFGGPFTATLHAQITGPGASDATIQAANIFLVREINDGL